MFSTPPKMNRARDDRTGDRIQVSCKYPAGTWFVPACPGAPKDATHSPYPDAEVRMKSLIPLAALLFLLVDPSRAAETQTIRLNDGTVLRGDIVSENDSLVVVNTEELGRVTIKRSRIAPLPTRGGDARSRYADADPIGHTLVLTPTAFLPPKGAVVFRDFELLFLTLGYSPTATTSVVAGAMFPVSADFNALTFGVKQGVFQDDEARTALAVVGNITMPVGREINDAAILWLANAVASHRVKPGLGLHAAVGGVGVQGRGTSNQGLSLAAGFDARLTGNVKLLGEILRGGTSFDPNSSLTLANLGIRLHGERLSADIAAMRPLGQRLGDLLFIPLINVGYRF